MCTFSTGNIRKYTRKLYGLVKTGHFRKHIKVPLMKDSDEDHIKSGTTYTNKVELKTPVKDIIGLGFV